MGNTDAFNYFEYLPMDTSRDAALNYAGMLDAIQPDLMIFDSWAGFLSLCDFSEDSNTDVER